MRRHCNVSGLVHSAYDRGSGPEPSNTRRFSGNTLLAHPPPSPSTCDNPSRALEFIAPALLFAGAVLPSHRATPKKYSGVLESGSMSRRYVSQLAHQEAIDQIFLASDKQLRPNRNGNLYLQIELSDRSGAIGAGCGTPASRTIAASRTATTCGSRARPSSFRARSNSSPAASAAQKTDVNPDDFMTLGSKEVDQLVLRLSAFPRKMRDPHLLNLAECFLIDEEFMRK